MTKILLWDYPRQLRNCGGPTGYLYNIYTYWQKIGDYRITFLNSLLGEENNVPQEREERKINRWVKKLVHPKFAGVYQLIVIKKRWKPVKDVAFLSKLNLNQFDIIHFHDPEDLLGYYPYLKSIQFRGKIVMTTHSPVPAANEITDERNTFAWVKILFRRKFERLEIKTWEKCDLLMFPVQEAVKVYYPNPYLKNFIVHHPERLIYCPTGILETYEKSQKINIRELLNIPEDAFVLTYVGRHNEIKGYDQLKLLGELLLNEYSNLYIIIAGKEYPLTRLKHKRWIELGWINFGNSLIEQSDLFVLPNKETYFDLIALEVIRSGTPMMMSQTGGNKYFEKCPGNDGLFFFPYGDLNSQREIVKKVINLKLQGKLEVLRVANRELFKREFTMQAYMKRYLSLMESITHLNGN